MNKVIFVLGLLLSSVSGFAQVAKGAGVFYFNGPPSLSVAQCYDSEIGIDTSSGYWYEYSRDFGAWIKAGFRVQLYDTCLVPTYIPVDKQSEVILTSCDSLYRWRSGAWHHLNPGGGGLQTIANTSDATSHTATLSDAGGSIQLVEGANITLTTSGTGLDGIVTIAAAAAAGTDLTFSGTGSPVTLNSSTGTDVTFNEGGIVSLSATGTNLTITATEVDGSITNEGILGVGAGGATSSTLVTNTSTGNAVTINVAGINTISETPSANGGSITITATEVDGSVSNELQTIANTSDATSHTATLSNGGGSLKLIEGASITLTTGGTGLNGTVTIASTATGTVTGAENGLNVVANNVRLGGNLLATTSIEGDANELRFYDGKLSFSSWTGFANSPVQFIRLQGLESSPTAGATPVLDGIVEYRLHNSGGSDQSNSLTVGGYATDSDGIWLQSRSASVPNVKYPLSLQPRGGQMSVGRLNSLSSLVTFTGAGLTGSTAAGSVLLLENLEASKISLAFGNGLNNVSGEVAFFSSDIFRVTNRNSTNGTSAINFAIGGETSDVAAMVKSSALSLVKFGVGTTSPHSTLQSGGSFAAAQLGTNGAPTFDETKHFVYYEASVNITWTIPTPGACSCPGREYVLHHVGSGGTITLSESISKGNTGNFNTLAAGEWAHIFYTDTHIRGYKLTSD